MLKQLYIKNYALFSETRVDFPAGLNILTGETGAGKSLLVGALGLIIGRRADSSVFMHEEKCIIEASFTNLAPSIRKQLAGFEDFDVEEGEVLIRREIKPNGKSRAFVNDTPVSLQALRQVSGLLLDLHGQHENQVLLANDRQIDLLDAYADADLLRERFAYALREVKQVQQEIIRLQEEEKQAATQLEYLQFQESELSAADIKETEEEELEAELNLLQNSEEIREALGGAVSRIYDEDTSIYSQLSEVLEPLVKVEDVNAQLKGEVSRLRDVQETLKEASFAFQAMLETVESNPERLAFIEERLAIYHQLKLKYKVRDGAELVTLYQEVQKKLEAVGNLESRVADLEKKYHSLQEHLAEIGLELEAKRLAAKPVLEKKILKLLSQVGFNKARFEVAVERPQGDEKDLPVEGQQVKTTPKGINKVYFLIQTNPGMPAGPLSQIASGGEISRVMLAIKAALAEKSEFPVMIFDEIDTGISGEIANKVGDVMRMLSDKFQILSITHLPQIAAKGHQHFFIRKKIKGDRTVSSVAPLSHEDRVKVIAQMLSGEQPTDSALRNAEELMAG